MNAVSVVPGGAVRFEKVGHGFGSTPVLRDIELEILPGELVAVLGPSGCGKSTLLRILAGLLRQRDGRVLIDGQAVDGRGPAERGVGIVFQNYALFPHLTVAANVGYGLQARRVDRRRIDAVVADMLTRVRMSDFADRYPRQLSGGQQQRVALARTLAVGPRILLLDEPLAALDKNLRLEMQAEIRRLQREFSITTVMVTHDQEEALTMADRVAVLNGGRLEQFDTPVALYDRPASPFVAGFVGSSTLVPARLRREGEGFVAQLASGGELWLPQASPCAHPGEVLLGVRPEYWRLADPAQGLAARVRSVRALGGQPGRRGGSGRRFHHHRSGAATRYCRAGGGHLRRAVPARGCARGGFFRVLSDAIDAEETERWLIACCRDAPC